MRKIHLRLNALCADDAIVRRLSGGVVEERAPADARFPAQGQSRTVSSSPSCEQLIEHALLTRAPRQLPAGDCRAGIRTHVVEVHGDSLAAPRRPWDPGIAP